MKFYYYYFVTDAKATCINIKLKEDHYISSILWDALKSINPKDEMITPFEERFNDIWELGVQSTAGYFKVKIELPFDDVWINGSAETITVIDLLLQKDERFQQLNV